MQTQFLQDEQTYDSLSLNRKVGKRKICEEVMVTRRHFIQTAGAGFAALALQGLLPGWARAATGLSKVVPQKEGNPACPTPALVWVMMDGAF